MTGLGPIAQLAYAVMPGDDVADAARRHHERFGSGPFFVSRHIPLAEVRTPDGPGAFDHSSAYGQWGPVMVELVQVHAAAPAGLAHATGHSGVHHVAIVVPSLAAAASELEAAGHRQVMLATTSGGMAFAFHDGGPGLGHLVELYEPHPRLVGFYAMVKAAADGWDGTDPVRELA